MWWIRSPRRAAGALGVSFVLALVVGQRPTPLCAQRDDIPAAPVELVLDLSSGMRGRMGEVEKFEVAQDFVRALGAELAAGGAPPALGLRVYGADTPRASRDCRDSRLVVSTADTQADLGAVLGELEPRGVAPLAYAIESALADTARTYVLIAGGLGDCGGDACGAWRAAAARGNRNARLHVVAIAQDPQQVDLLRCLSRAGSGTFLVLSDPAEVGRAAARLALILKNQGLIDVRLSLGGRETIAAPIRILVPRSRDVAAVFSGRGPHALPAGIYSVVVETAPPITLERVLVLPGETVTVERSDFGRLQVGMRDGENRTVRAPLTVRARPRGTEVRYAFTGETIVLRSGTYDIAVDLGDSLVSRRGVVIDTGRTTRIVLGGTGTLLVVSPEFPTPPPTRVILSRGVETDTLRVGETATVPAGRYRLHVETIPVFVSDEVAVDYGETTTIELPVLGALRVSTIGPQGPVEGIVARDTKQFKVTGVPELDLETFDGAIEIHSWDRSEVEVEIEKRAMEQSLVDEMKVVAEQQGNKIIIKVSRPGRSDRQGIQIGVNFSPSARLRVALPRKSNITAKSNDGSVSIEDVTGRVMLTTGDGSVRAVRLAGDITVRSGDGAIRLDAVEGNLDFETDDGSISGEAKPASLRAHTGDGSIRIEVQRESKMNADWDVETSDGSIVLTLPSDFNGMVDAETRDGTVRSNHPAIKDERRDGESREERRRQLKATLGAGGKLLRVRTGDGSIRIES